MRGSIKRLLIATLLAVALISPGVAGAAIHKLRGPVDPSGRVRFEDQRKHGKATVFNFHFTAIPMTCDGVPHTTSGNTGDYVFKVEDNDFGARLFNGKGAILRIEGHLRHHLKRASGTIRVHGDNVPVDGDESANGCDTGTLDWKAST